MRRLGNGTGWIRLAVGVVLVGLWSTPGTALGQSLKEQIVGTWQLVSQYTEEKGVKSYPYGDKPVGLLVFDASGNVSQFLAKPNLPKFAIDNRLKGTDKEYRDVMQGMLASIGTYTVEGSTVTVKWIASSYPNRAGTTEKRTYSISGDELSGSNPTASSGGTSITKWVRAK